MFPGIAAWRLLTIDPPNLVNLHLNAPDCPPTIPFTGGQMLLPAAAPDLDPGGTSQDSHSHGVAGKCMPHVIDGDG